MNIIHTIATMNAEDGGTATSTAALLNGLRDAGCRAELLTRTPAEYTFSPLQISPALRRKIRRAEATIFHTHGLWRDINHYTCAQARKRGIPYIISTHGMLYPEAMQRHSPIKQLLLRMGHRRDLQEAACIIVTSDAEYRHVRRLLPKARIAEIPLPVEPPDYLSEIRTAEHHHFRVGFLGRFHPIKNIESLIRAWGLLGLKNAELILIGSGQKSYTDTLRQLIRDVGAAGVSFVGFLEGRNKYAMLQSLDVLCAPSHQENFGMSIAEALQMGTPVLASRRTPWAVLHTRQCGYWQGNTATELAKGLLKFYRMSPEERRRMGDNGRRLIQEQFAPSVICHSLRQLYLYLLGKAPQPSFVHER